MRKEFFNTKKQALDLYMVNCGYEDCCADFVCRPHVRNYYLIHYVTKGTGYYEVNGEKYPLSAGDAFVIYPNELVTYYAPDVNTPWSFCWIGFSGKAAAAYFAAAGEVGYVKRLKNRGFYAAVSNCLSYLDENPGPLSQLKLSATVLECLHCLGEDGTSRRLSPVEQVDKAVRYIEYNYMNAISPRDVAMHLSLERSYFYRIFKKYTGASPEQYMIRYRIRKAAELIRFERYSLSEIAAFVGIRDVYYFSRLFKKVMGVSPSQYKKMD